MSMNANPSVQEWFRKNAETLIHCPFQPGDLKITKNACRQRHRAGKGMGIEEGELSLNSRGFEVCRRCPIAKNLPDAN